MGILAHGVFALRTKTRLLVAVLVFAALISVVIWRGLDLISSEKKIEVSPSASSKSSASALNALGEASKDSDQDGLKDWEEAILRTDPNKADSDGDGTPDGEEIAKNRDPLKKGPKDTVSNPSPLTPNPLPDDNLTYSLTKNLLESGVLSAIDNQGRITSTDFLNRMSLPKNIDPEELIKPTVTIAAKDLRVNQNSDTETVKNYFRSISEIYARRIAPHQARGDLVILAEALESSDFTKLAELDPLISALDMAVTDIRNIPVPSQYLSFAVRELDYLLRTRRLIEIFRNTPDDPLAAALAVRERFDLLIKIAGFHAETIKELLESGISFNPG